MPENKKEAYYTRGNRGFITRKLNAAETGHNGEPYLWSGLVETNITLSQTITEREADDNPAFAVIIGPLMGSGTIKMFGVKNDEYQHILPVLYVKGKGVRFGENLKPVAFSSSFIEQVSDGSENKIIFYKMIATAPPTATKSINREGNEVRDYTINVNAYPVFYPTQSGIDGRVTRDIINNVADKEIWEANKNTIVFPTEMIAPSGG